MKNLEDILWKGGLQVDGNDVAGEDSDFDPAKIPYNCMMICCYTNCSEPPPPQPTSSIGCR